MMRPSTKQKLFAALWYLFVAVAALLTVVYIAWLWLHKVEATWVVWCGALAFSLDAAFDAIKKAMDELE